MLTPDVSDAFYSRFARRPTLAASAPGRVNLMGDHTDYSGGLAMPCAIDLYTSAIAAPRDDDNSVWRVYSEQAPGELIELPTRPEHEARGDWADYLRGVRAGLAALGIAAPPMDILITGNLPLGSGLSSSASLELCFASLLEAAAGVRLDARARALLCQTAERDFAGVPCGILDQFAIAHARPGHAMMLDCRAQTIEHIPLPAEFEVIVLDSGVRHDLSDGGYAERRHAVTVIESLIGSSLRDMGLHQLSALEDLTLRRRAKHVITENQRVGQFARALGAGDMPQAGRVMLASHRSLARDFAVSCDEVDWIVDRVQEHGAFGARMTGGGFGGSVVCLAPQSSLPALKALVSGEYHETFGRTGELRRLKAVGAATAMQLELPE